MAQQLTFDLPVRTALGREDYFVAPSNQIVVAALDNWADWPGGMLMLVGPEGSGKTHLAHVWAAQTGARMLDANDLSAAHIAKHLTPQATVIEMPDLDAVGEETLFHFYNFQKASGLPLLLTARQAPTQWELTLKDLASRMQSIPVIPLPPPDDALLQAVMLKQFSDRQIAAPPNLITFLLGRIERSFASVQATVAALDAAGLAAGRPLTRPFTASVLDKLGDQGS